MRPMHWSSLFTRQRILGTIGFLLRGLQINWGSRISALLRKVSKRSHDWYERMSSKTSRTRDIAIDPPRGNLTLGNKTGETCAPELGCVHTIARICCYSQDRMEITEAQYE